jgi:heat shock protein HslJ
LLYDTTEPRALAGSRWEAISVNDGNEAVVSLVTGSAITAAFDDDGTLAGSGGCNECTAPYRSDGDTLSIGAVASTERTCADPQGVMAQEQDYYAALGNAATWTNQR